MSRKRSGVAEVVPATGAGMKRVAQEFVADYPLEKLRTHPENAKTGDREAIDDSIEATGFYGTLLVQRSTGFIVVGNHRFEAGKAKGAATLPVLLADLTDDQARRIMVADNRTSDLGDYDNAKLLALIEKVQGEAAEVETSLDGTGYDAGDVEALIARVQRDAETATEKALRVGSASSITYTVVFSDQTEQSAFYALIRALKGKYPGKETVGARFQALLADHPELVG